MKNKYFVVGDEVFIKLAFQTGATKDLWTVIDLADLEIVSSFSSFHNWYGEKAGYGYYAVMDFILDGKRIRPRMHRVIVGLDDSSIYEPDHKNRDSLDNRRSNLRIVRRTVNNLNKNLFKNNKSGMTGVFYNRRIERWNAYITLNNKRINLGHYIRKEDAIEARSKAEDAYLP